MISTLTRRKSLLLALLALTLLTGSFPSTTQAASSSWSSNVGYLEGYVWGTYCWKNCTDPSINDEKDGWAKSGAFDGMSVSVAHSAEVKNNTTGVTSDAPAVKIGDSISFLPAADSGTDIAWSITGYTSDTPYGKWSSTPTAVSCDDTTYVGFYQTGAGVGGTTVYYYGYLNLDIAPSTPTISKTGTATLSCDPGGFNCTVTGAGTIAATITWPATSGRFNYAYTKTGKLSSLTANYIPTGTCVSSGLLHMGPPWCSLGTINKANVTAYTACIPTVPTYKLSVPAQSIVLSLSATAAPSVDIYFSLFDTIKRYLSALFYKGGTGVAQAR